MDPFDMIMAGLAARPSGFERGRLYVSSDEMERWLDSIAEGGAE
jgi:hypothetical protein